jgi:rubrerythrin
MERSDRLNALETALENEMNERKFYLAQAEQTENALGKAMFLEIANDELEHYERLKKLHETWKAGKDWPDTVPLTVKQTNVKQVFSSLTADAADMRRGNDDDLAALKKAVDFEAKGAAFYRKLSGMVSEPLEKKFFDLLAGMEEEHYRSLKETEEYLLDPAAWFRATEHGGGLDGA